MKATWTPNGALTATLGDDSVKHTIVLEQIGGQSVDQVEQLFGAVAAAQFPRGNVAGELAFVAAKSHADYATALTFFQAEYARLNGQGSLVLTQGSATLTFAGAVLRGVERLPAQEGLRWHVRYRFGITTIQ